jgi:hypothetical protein
MILENLNQTPASPLAMVVALVPFAIVGGLEVYLHWRYPRTYEGGFVWRRTGTGPQAEPDSESASQPSAARPLQD